MSATPTPSTQAVRDAARRVPSRGPGRGHHQPRRPGRATSRSTPAARSTCWRRCAAGPTRRRSCSPRPTRSTASCSTPAALERAGDALAARATRPAAAAATRPRRSTSTAPTAARRASPTSTCSTTRRVFGLPTVVFRMSCLYGPRQFGTEDQGWIAHFLIRALQRQPITIYGDGRQVRDALFVDDAVDAWLAAWRGIDRVRGRAFNLGGGPAQHAQPARAAGADRAADRRRARGPLRRGAAGRPALVRLRHRRALAEATGWRPRTGLDEGLDRLGRLAGSSARRRAAGRAP